NVSMPDVFRLRYWLLKALSVITALETAVIDTPPEPFVELLVSLKVLPETPMTSDPVSFLTSTRFSPPVASPLTKLKVELVIDDVPLRSHSFTSPSPGASPNPFTVLLSIVRFDTDWPLMPT